MAEIWLLCEGKSDRPVLSAVLTRVLATDIIIKATGGTSNVSGAAAYVSGQDGSATVAYVIDRDYNTRAKAEATFTDGKRGFMWRRHAIESYLLEPAVIREAFRSMKASVADNPGGGPAWMKALPEDPTVVAAGLRLCAQERAPEEASRIAMQRLWEDLSETAGRIQKRNPSLPSGAKSDASTCRQAFVEETCRLTEKAQETVASPHLSPASIAARYDAELARVSADEYLNNLLFLEEFHGRDLLSVFYGWLQREHRFKLSSKGFMQELEKAMPDAYKANRSLYRTDDFLDLANGVRALAKLPPIV